LPACPLLLLHQSIHPLLIFYLLEFFISFFLLAVYCLLFFLGLKSKTIACFVGNDQLTRY